MTGILHIRCLTTSVEKSCISENMFKRNGSHLTGLAVKDPGVAMKDMGGT
jgi:hypothetical protein